MSRNLVFAVLTVTASVASAIPASAATLYWSLFNFEEEDELDAIYVTYGSLLDMLTDSNRTGTFVPEVTGLSAANVVGSGASAVLDPAPIPLPGAGVLLGSAFLAGALARRRRASSERSFVGSSLVK